MAGSQTGCFVSLEFCHFPFDCEQQPSWDAMRCRITRHKRYARTVHNKFWTCVGIGFYLGRLPTVKSRCALICTGTGRYWVPSCRQQVIPWAGTVPFGTVRLLAGHFITDDCRYTRGALRAERCANHRASYGTGTRNNRIAGTSHCCVHHKRLPTTMNGTPLRSNGT